MNIQGKLRFVTQLLGHVVTVPMLLGALSAGLLWGLPALLRVLEWAPVTWSLFTVDIRETSFAPMSILVVTSCIAGRFSAGQSLLRGSWMPRSGAPAMASATIRLVIVTWVGAAGPLAASVLISHNRTTAGSAPLLALAAALASIPVWVVLGYAIGMVAPRGWDVLISLAAWFVVGVSPSIAAEHTGLLVYAVSPVWFLQWPLIGNTVPPAIYVFRIIFFPLATYAAITLIDVLAMKRYRTQKDRLARAAAVIVAGSFLFTVGIAWQPDLLMRETPMPAVCNESGTVCIHEAHGQLLDRINDIVRQQNVITGRDTVVREVVVADPQRTFDVSAGEVILHLEPQFRLSEDAFWMSIRDSIARAHSGEAGCLARMDGDGSAEVAAEVVFREIVTRTYALDSGESATQRGFSTVDIYPLQTHLQGLNNHEFTQWLNDNRTAVDMCQLDLSTES
jgi:hypothetical protein